MWPPAHRVFADDVKSLSVDFIRDGEWPEHISAQAADVTDDSYRLVFRDSEGATLPDAPEFLKLHIGDNVFDKGDLVPSTDGGYSLSKHEDYFMSSDWGEVWFLKGYNRKIQVLFGGTPTRFDAGGGVAGVIEPVDPALSRLCFEGSDGER
jgi:hypothetical protein